MSLATPARPLDLDQRRHRLVRCPQHLDPQRQTPSPDNDPTPERTALAAPPRYVTVSPGVILTETMTSCHARLPDGTLRPASHRTRSSCSSASRGRRHALGRRQDDGGDRSARPPAHAGHRVAAAGWGRTSSTPATALACGRHPEPRPVDLRCRRRRPLAGRAAGGADLLVVEASWGCSTGRATAGVVDADVAARCSAPSPAGDRRRARRVGGSSARVRHLRQRIDVAGVGAEPEWAPTATRRCCGRRWRPPACRWWVRYGTAG